VEEPESGGALRLDGSFQGGDETIAPPRQRLHVLGLFGWIPDGATQLVDRLVEAVLEVDEDGLWPEAPT
jgi:hypothetical protein